MVRTDTDECLNLHQVDTFKFIRFAASDDNTDIQVPLFVHPADVGCSPFDDR